MTARPLRAFVLAVAVAMLALVASAGASATKSCGSVSITLPNTHGEGHAALNNLTARDVSCATARSVAKTVLITGKPPTNWHAHPKTVVVHRYGQTNTVGELILSRGEERVIGDVDS